MLYQTKATLEVNGNFIDDIKVLRIGERTLGDTFRLMNKFGRVKMAQEHRITVEYFPPADSPEFDWESVEEGRLTIRPEGGSPITYTGVTALSMGDRTYDGEAATSYEVQLFASGRVVE